MKWLILLLFSLLKSPILAHLNAHQTALAHWANALVEHLLAGCVPVLLADGVTLPFSDFVDWRSFLLKFHEKDLNENVISFFCFPLLCQYSLNLLSWTND